jgi:hypothetical protein
MDATTQRLSRPYWISEGIKFGALPQAPQVGITEILNPTCQELVLKAADVLERSAWTIFVRLLWLELLLQFELSDPIDTRLRPTVFRGAAPGAAQRVSRIAGRLENGTLGHALGNICLMARECMYRTTHKDGSRSCSWQSPKKAPIGSM